MVGCELTWPRCLADNLHIIHACGRVQPAIAAARPLAAYLEGELVSSHADQQFDKLLRRLQLELTRSGSREEASEYGLGDVHRVEHAEHPAVFQPKPNLPADYAFKLTDKLTGSTFIARANPQNERIER